MCRLGPLRRRRHLDLDLSFLFDDHWARIHCPAAVHAVQFLDREHHVEIFDLSAVGRYRPRRRMVAARLPGLLGPNRGAATPEELTRHLEGISNGLYRGSRCQAVHVPPAPPSDLYLMSDDGRQLGPPGIRTLSGRGILDQDRRVPNGHHCFTGNQPAGEDALPLTL